MVMTAVERAELLTPEQAAEMAQVNKRTITRMCVEGQVRAVKVRSMWRINRADLMRVLGLN